ncbi:MAG TPA: hypothetical protein EYP25_14475 [Anaerolineae bacterium]|nr:hypothetical protein [Anaerolineae bacterium]
MKKLILLSFALLLLAGAATWVYAASTTIDWDVAASGGGNVSAGDIALDDTIGQPVVDLARAGDVVIESGFWHGMGVSTSTPTPTSIRIYLPYYLKR